ncbi:MAG: DUF4446 family protein [Armatimonadetes bacterium]|nr:DUF4446 family protein [Armatimonadota bacterium]
MGFVFDFLRANYAHFLLGLLLLNLILIASLVVISRRLSRLASRYDKRLMDGSVGGIVDRLTEQTSAISRIESRLDEINARQLEQAEAIKGCLQKVGLVRFDAFDDVGGEQSFALVLLDAKGNGIAMSSLYGRQDSRLYAKGIQGGESERTLSDEEQAALAKALATDAAAVRTK